MGDLVRVCPKCIEQVGPHQGRPKAVDHQHIHNHHVTRIHSNPKYHEQIAKDIAAGMIPAKDERVPLTADDIAKRHDPH